MIKDSQVNAESLSDTTHNANITSHGKTVESLPKIQDLLVDPPIVKRKGKNGAMKSWIDKLNNKRKSTEMKARKKSKESTRLDAPVVLDDDHTQEQLPKKKFRKQGKNKVAFREITNQPESFLVQQ
ncbi:hypothetical protein C5167_006143 [Papaver somniferum]|uniref:Uncharacterized protein n=1 Tax=Papaver somniferum TaxID=3469 RepID=A0A4Y7JFP6_PAPSO|nr:hypothetical protein C5167_006143 [Papaver somniferum]